MIPDGNLSWCKLSARSSEFCPDTSSIPEIQSPNPELEKSTPNLNLAKSTSSLNLKNFTLKLHLEKSTSNPNLGKSTPNLNLARSTSSLNLEKSTLNLDIEKASQNPNLNDRSSKIPNRGAEEKLIKSPEINPTKDGPREKEHNEFLDADEEFMISGIFV